MRRVVVTGLGLVTPLGGDVETTWANILAGKSGAGKITHFALKECDGMLNYPCVFFISTLLTGFAKRGDK